MSVQMELNKIIISEMQDQQIIVLKEVDGERQVPHRHRQHRGRRHRPPAQGARATPGRSRTTCWPT